MMSVYSNLPYGCPTRAEIAADDKQQRRIRYHSLLFFQCCGSLTETEAAELSAIAPEFAGEPIEGALSDSEYDFMRSKQANAA